MEKSHSINIFKFFQRTIIFIKPIILAEDGIIYLDNSINNSFWNIFDTNNTG